MSLCGRYIKLNRISLISMVAPKYYFITWFWQNLHDCYNSSPVSFSITRLHIHPMYWDFYHYNKILWEFASEWGSLDATFLSTLTYQGILFQGTCSWSLWWCCPGDSARLQTFFWPTWLLRICVSEFFACSRILRFTLSPGKNSDTLY